MSQALAQRGWYDRNYFLLRRLHSLSGIVPVGVFLVEHLLTNSTAALGWVRQDGALVGGEQFDEHVFWLHRLPYLPWIELLTIFLPLAYHAGFGVLIALTAKSNIRHYAYADNWRYTLQRLTGWIALAFILLHLGHFRLAHWFGGTPYVGTDAPYDLLQRGFMSSWAPLPVWLTVYAIGLTASVYHFANGITTFCITWGVTVNESSRQRISLASLGVGLLLLTWGALSLWAIANVDPRHKLGDRARPDVHLVEGNKAG